MEEFHLLNRGGECDEQRLSMKDVGIFIRFMKYKYQTVLSFF